VSPFIEIIFKFWYSFLMNQEYRSKILEQFDPYIAAELLEFGESLSQLEGDVFVLMSRKFCCLYKLLLSIGISGIKKTVVSDKLLYTKTDLFRGKVVTLIDDIVICGSTIWKAKDRLLNEKGVLNAKEVKLYIFCADEKYWVPKLIYPDYPLHVLSENKAIMFCSSIVRALSIAPIPYSVEFPVFKEITITEDEWNLFAWSGGWIVKDITSKIQEENNIAVFTISPAAVIENKIKKIFGKKAYNLIEIHKIRIFAKLGNCKVTFTMLPMITIKPLSEANNNTLFDFMIKNLKFIGCSPDTLSSFEKEFDNPVVKLRFIQYITSLTLSTFFKHSICKTIDKELPYDLVDFDVQLLFGKENVPLFKELIDCFVVQDHIDYKRIKNFFKKINTLDEIAPVELDDSEVDFHLKDSPKLSEVRDILADYNDIFRKYHYERELPERKKIKEMAEKDDYDGIRSSKRLEEGIAWNQIIIYYSKIAKSDIDKKFKRALLLILDYSIDRGVCVPIIQYDEVKGIIYRSYRHGEDVLFVEQQIALCGLAIENAQKALNRDKIPKLFLEKLLVLFIKMGIKKKIFEEQYGTRGQESIASIDFYLQGAVVKFYDKNQMDSARDMWLHEYLVEEKIIEGNEGDGYSYVFPKEGKFTITALKAESVREAKHFGNVMGELYKGLEINGKKQSLTSEDFIFLVSCDTPKNVSRALCAEIEIFLKQYNFLKNRILKVNNNYGGNIGFIALNSLHTKTIAWIDNKSIEVIKKGRDILEKVNDRDMSDWDVYCNDLEISDSKSEKERFDQYIIDFSRIGHRLLFYFDMFRAYPNANDMSKFIKFYNASEELTKKLIANQRIIIENKNDKKLLTEGEKKTFEDFLAYYNSNWENYPKAEFNSLIIQNLDSYKHEAQETFDMFKLALGDHDFGKGLMNCEYVVYCEILIPVGINEEKICKAKDEVDQTVKRMFKEYNKASKNQLYARRNLLEDDNDVCAAFPKNEEINIKFIKTYLNYLSKISSDYGIYFCIIICSADEFTFNIEEKVRYKYDAFLNTIKEIHKKISENEKTYGTSRSGSSPTINSPNKIMVVDNFHDPDIGTQLPLKFISRNTFTIQDNEIAYKIYTM
jgi:hypothetical protein